MASFTCALKFFCLRTALFAGAMVLVTGITWHNRIRAAGPAEAKRSVVVELFTSEGCSSCPPADELLGRLRQEPNGKGAEVIPLGLHVDYWDFQGWRDRFDSPAFTKRQQDYAHRFRIEGPYTPQMVVNGAVQFVGSSASRADEAIREAGGQPDAAKVELSFNNSKLAVKISGGHGDVLLALTEDNLSTKVGAGENGGHTLHHSAVVRELRRIGEMKSDIFYATAPLEIAGDWKREDVRVVVFVQERGNGKIEGAASRPLNELIALQ
jgi:hypothetical protein